MAKGPTPPGGHVLRSGVDIPADVEDQLHDQLDPTQLNVNVYAADGAISVASQLAFLTKGSAGAYTLAAPTDADDGTTITITAGSDFAHVVTFTGSTLHDGTTGGHLLWTSAAFKGSSL